MYLYMTSSDITDITVSSPSGDITQDLDNPYILDIGYMNAGDEAVITLDCSQCESSASYTIYAYSLNQKVFELGYNELLNSSLNISKYSDTKIEGTVRSDGNSVLYTSIPYDEGWSVYVDGQKVETFDIGSSQLGVMMKPGEHTVKFKYTPRGLVSGCVVTVIAIIIVGAIGVMNLKRRKKKKETKNTNLSI